MTELVIIPPDQLSKIVADATAAGLRQGQIAGEPKYYSPAQLAEMFPFSARNFRKWIGIDGFGKVTKTGMKMATYKEVVDFLTNREK